MGTSYKRLAVYIQILYSFPITILAGAGLGFLIDKWLNSKPVGVLIGSLLGISAAFYSLFHLLNQIQKNDKKDNLLQ